MLFKRSFQSIATPLSLLILALILLSACGAAPTPTPTPTKTPLPPTPTDTPLPANTVTPAPAKPAAASPTPVKPGAPTLTPVAKPKPTTPPTATPTRAPVTKPCCKMNSPEYGVQTFLWWQPETTDRDLKAVKEAGFTWIKHSFAWTDIEGAAKGAFDWEWADHVVNSAQKYGLDIVARVDKEPAWARAGATKGPVGRYEDFGDFLFAMASRYKGKIRAYEIWNEPNLAREWGNKPPDVVEYVKMLKIAYQRIKQADPNAMVVTAGMSPTTSWGDAIPDVEFYKRLYVAGGKPYFDVLGAHAAGYKAPPETDPGDIESGKLKQYCAWEKECARIYAFRHLEDVRKVMVDNGDSAKQVMVLEFGWTTDVRPNSLYKWHGVTEQEQADYIVRAFQWAKTKWSPWIGMMSLIYIAKPDWNQENEEYWWSITLPNGQKRPAYEAIKRMVK